MLNGNIDLLEEHSAAVRAGEAIESSSPFSIESLSRQAGNLKWVTLASIAGAFIYLYATLVYMVWEGWRTIGTQRTMLESTSVELESQVDEVARERSTLAAIQESMNEALVVVDGEGKVAYLNGSAQDLLGLTLKGAQGKSVREALGGRAGDFESPEELEALIGLADGQGDSASIAVKLVSPEPRDLEVSSFSIPAGSNETMTGLLARDVTQERELQDRRDAFVSIASHELRTPMTSIMGFSELMLNNASAPDASRRDWLKKPGQQCGKVQSRR